MDVKTQTASQSKEVAEKDFLSLSFEALNQVEVRVQSGSLNSIRIEAQQAGEVQSKPVDFLKMSFEQLSHLPVRFATLTAKEKEKEANDSKEVTSSAITLADLPLVLSEQSLKVTVTSRGEVQSIEKDLISDTTTTTTTETTSQPPVPVPSIVTPITPTPIIVLPQFLAIGGVNAVSVLVRNADGTFFTQPSIPIGSPTQGVAVRDLNNDGILDLVVTSVTTNTISIFLGTSIGTFGPQNNFSVSNTSQAPAAIADFNRDGNLDLAVSNTGGGGVSVLLGTGTGSFGPATNFPAGTTSFGIVVGDFNGDKIVDLAVANLGSNNVSILLGTGDGSFLPPVNFPLSSAPETLVVGDFNGDNILDIAVPYLNVDTVAIFLGTGNGSFGPETQFPTNIFPSGIVVGDFNRDGILDLAIGTAVANDICILLGTGNGSFGAPTIFGTGGSFAENLCVGDFNGDGILDLAVVNSGSGNMGVLFGNGDGTFQPPVVYTLTIFSPGTIAVGILLPVGISGSPINLALSNPSSGNNNISVTIEGIPLGWMLNMGVNNLDGSWTIETTDPESLIISTAPDFVGSKMLSVNMSWIASNGSIACSQIKDCVTAYAPGSAIFALPGDNLTGSIYADNFVITKSKSAVQDTIFNFDSEFDIISLIDFSDTLQFSDLHIMNDLNGNAMVSIDSGNHSILLEGVKAESLHSSHFLFNVTPYSANTGMIDIGKSAIMPFSGILANDGTIQVEGTLIMHGDITGTGKIILGSSGVLELKGHINQDILCEIDSIPILFKHLDLNLATLTTISLQTLLE